MGTGQREWVKEERLTVIQAIELRVMLCHVEHVFRGHVFTGCPLSCVVCAQALKCSEISKSTLSRILQTFCPCQQSASSVYNCREGWKVHTSKKIFFSLLPISVAGERTLQAFVTRSEAGVGATRACVCVRAPGRIGAFVAAPLFSCWDNCTVRWWL